MKMNTTIYLCLLAVAFAHAIPSHRQDNRNRTGTSTRNTNRSRPSPLQVTVSGSEEKPDSVKITDGTKPVLEMSGENNSSTPMDPAVMKVLSRVLETLESIRDARTKELNQASKELDALASTQKESSSGPFGVHTDQLDNKKKPIIKKTYGYKVTVYATPLNGSKDEGQDDLQPAGTHNHGVIHAYGHQPVPYHGTGRVGAANRGGGIHKTSGGSHHKDRKELEDKGYSRGEKNKDEKVNHEEKDRHYYNEGGHVREAQDIGHNRGEFGHDRGAANEKGLKEKTQIEYFERERGEEEEEVKKGGKESEGHHTQNGQQAVGGQGSAGQYYGHKPHYGGHYVQTPYVSGHHAHGQHSGGGGQRANAHDLHKRRKHEGLKERGFKITVEREVYLRDGFHDKGFGRHDQAHHKELAEKGNHKIDQGDVHKHLTKEVKEHEGFDKGYGLRKHESSAGEQGGSHLKEQHAAGHIGHVGSTPQAGVTYVAGEHDQHYSPSNEAELATSVVKNETSPVRQPSLKEEYNRAKVVPTIAESEEQVRNLQRSRQPGGTTVRSPERPRRPQAPRIEEEDEKLDSEDEKSDSEESPPKTRSRRPPPPKVNLEDDLSEDIQQKPRNYLPKVSLRAPRVRGQPPPPRNESRVPYGNSFLDSITPPTGEDRFAFNPPPTKNVQSGQIRFPNRQEQLHTRENNRGGPVSVQPVPIINLYIPNNGNNQDHHGTHYDLHAYPQSNEVPRPNPDIELIRRHRVFVPKELSTYQKLGFSQPVLQDQTEDGQGPTNHVTAGVWYAPTVIDHKKK